MYKVHVIMFILHSGKQIPEMLNQLPKIPKLVNDEARSKTTQHGNIRWGTKFICISVNLQ